MTTLNPIRQAILESAKVEDRINELIQESRVSKDILRLPVFDLQRLLKQKKELEERIQKLQKERLDAVPKSCLSSPKRRYAIKALEYVGIAAAIGCEIIAKEEARTSSISEKVAYIGMAAAVIAGISDFILSHVDKRQREHERQMQLLHVETTQEEMFTGFLQALGYFQAKKDAGHKDLRKIMDEWRQVPPSSYRKGFPDEETMVSDLVRHLPEQDDFRATIDQLLLNQPPNLIKEIVMEGEKREARNQFERKENLDRVSDLPGYIPPVSKRREEIDLDKVLPEEDADADSDNVGGINTRFTNLSAQKTANSCWQRIDEMIGSRLNYLTVGKEKILRSPSPQGSPPTPAPRKIDVLVKK